MAALVGALSTIIGAGTLMIGAIMAFKKGEFRLILLGIGLIWIGTSLRKT